MAGEDGSQSPVVPEGDASEWSFNWPGLVGLVLIVGMVIVGWRWVGGSGDDAADSLGVTGPTAPADSTSPSALATSPSTTTTVPAPTTTLGPTTTATVAAGDPRVLIRGEMKPCRYGDRCLVASFTIEGFDEHPGRFTCIYPNSESEFPFRSNGVDDACLTADQGDTLTIEIDGVRSATISEQDLGGA